MLICSSIQKPLTRSIKSIISAVFILVLANFSSGNAEAQQKIAETPWEDSYSASAFADGVIRESFCDLVSLVEGTFGGLLFAAAGLMAFGFAAFGDSKHGSTAAIVAGAAFSMSAGVSLYFGDLGCGAGAGSGSGATERSKITFEESDQISSRESLFEEARDEDELF